MELHAANGTIVISAAGAPRAGWAAAAAKMAEREDSLLDPETTTPFDDEERDW